MMVRGKCHGIAAILIGLATLLAIAPSLSAQTVRRNVNSPDAARMLASYARAIEVMRRLPANDPHNWTFQANLHGYPAGTANPVSLWGQCQHGHWWFLPWHRAYQHAFEKIIRVHSGDPTFALPYWDWSDPASRTLPAPFRNANSELFDGSRRPAVNNGTDALTDPVVVNDVNYALSRPAFFTLDPTVAQNTFGGLRIPMLAHLNADGGALEWSPHNYVHGWVGGNMGDPDRAARDPVFHLHHTNLDRLWEAWRAGAGHQNPTDDAVWMNQTFALYDENKRPYVVAVRDLLNTGAQLNYVYDSVPRQLAAALAGKTTRTAVPSVRTRISLEPQKPWGELRREPMQIALRLDETMAASLKQLAKKKRVSKSELILVVEGITFQERVADSALEVYLNAPIQARISNLKSPYFADMCSFFGPVKNQTARFRLGDAFDRLRSQESFRPEALTITLNRHWFGTDAPATPKAVTFQKVSLLVEP